jgi:tetratricopeptide (TPR) repeat protein
MTELFAEAHQSWNLIKLYRDIAVIKGLPMTNWEKTCLRGLLCRYSPKTIASKTYWTGSSLRTELSRRLYPCIANLTNKERVVWHKIADDLAQMGYENLDKLNQDIAQASSVDPVLTVSEIINTIMSLGIDNSKVNPDSNIIAIATKNIQKAHQLNRSEDYSAALDCYHLALKSSASLDINILINMARCYDRLKKYSDSLAICYFALNFADKSVQPSSDKCKLYNFIAGVFHDLAIAHHDKAYLNTAIDYYQRAATSNPDDILPIWNQVNIILCSVKERILEEPEEREFFLKITYKKMELLLTISRQSSMYLKYRVQILKDMRSTFGDLGSFWQQQYYRFQDLDLP